MGECKGSRRDGGMRGEWEGWGSVRRVGGMGECEGMASDGGMRLPHVYTHKHTQTYCFPQLQLGPLNFSGERQTGHLPMGSLGGTRARHLSRSGSVGGEGMGECDGNGRDEGM